MVHFSMSPFSSDRPSRCGPRASGQSPSATLWGPWAAVSALRRRTRGPTTKSRFSMGFTRLRHLTARCFVAPAGTNDGTAPELLAVSVVSIGHNDAHALECVPDWPRDLHQ